MRPRSLRAIMTIYVVVFLVALVAIRIVSYRIDSDALRRQVDRRLASEASAISGGISQKAMIGRIDAAQNDHDTADLFYMLLDKNGRQIAGELRLKKQPPIGYSDFGDDARVEGVAHGRALARRVGGDTLVVVSDNDVVEDFDRMLFRVQLIGLAITALIVIGGAIGIMMVIGGRMRAMQRTVDAVMEGDLKSRVPLDGSRSEFDQQAAAFNRMLDRIDELMANIKHAAKDVTHELKSPLARLRARVAAIARRTEEDPVGADIADVLEQTDQIIELFGSLLRLWEIEGGHRRERFADVEMSDLVRDVGEALLHVSEDDAHVLQLDILDGLSVRGDPNLLRQMLVNLVENAIRHTPAGTRILVSVERRGHSIAVSVADDGPGIPAAAHDTVIRRFGRLEAEGKPAGQGLGLTLVDAIARLHDGSLVLEDAGPGLRAVVVLPLHR
ncbi:MAG: ATP-binding protein [Sphingomonas sp.]|uniref:HAMP domain-containing sensor histidine kinase n=1 Tax=Sphingomonas sp. TaxID=28214 RepID=UPI003569BFB9